MPPTKKHITEANIHVVEDPDLSQNGTSNSEQTGKTGQRAAIEASIAGMHTQGVTSHEATPTHSVTSQVQEQEQIFAQLVKLGWKPCRALRLKQTLKLQQTLAWITRGWIPRLMTRLRIGLGTNLLTFITADHRATVTRAANQTKPNAWDRMGTPCK